MENNNTALTGVKMMIADGIVTQDVAEKYFPELKKSKDERTQLTEFLKDLIDKGSSFRYKREDFERWKAWLEKQKVLTAEEYLQGKEDVLWCIKQAEKHAKDEDEMCTCWFAEKWLEKQGEQILDSSAKTCKDEQKTVEWHREDEQNLNTCLSYIPDEYLRRWLVDVVHVKYDKPAVKVEPKFKKD